MPRRAHSITAFSAAAIAMTLLPPMANAAPKSGETEEAAAADAFVDLEGIRAPIVDSGRLNGVLDLTIVLQARTAAAVPDLTRRKHELRAAALAGAVEFARLYASPYTPVDVKRLRAMLTPALRRVSAEVQEVLIVRVGAFSG